MKAVITHGAAVVRRVVVTPYRGLIMVSVSTKEKRPKCWTVSSLGPGEFRSQTIVLESESADEPWTKIELIPEIDEEKELMRNGAFLLYDNRYGPTYLFVPLSTIAEEQASVVLFEKRSDKV